jgi:hypothetical protein
MKKHKHFFKDTFEKGLNLTSLDVVKHTIKMHLEESVSLKELIYDPEIEPSGEFDINKGEHHSKDFVEEFGEKIGNNEFIKSFVKHINSSEYNSNKKGFLIITRSKHNQNEYIVHVFSKKHDAGYGVEIQFSAKEKWKVILLTKILKHQIKELRDYTLEIKD